RPRRRGRPGVPARDADGRPLPARRVLMGRATMAIDRRFDISQPLEKLSPDERLKAGSNQLRGTIVESLADPVTGAVRETDAKLMKFHGIYQQDDRDLREERRQQKLEPAYQFMIRVRLPGG